MICHINAPPLSPHEREKFLVYMVLLNIMELDFIINLIPLHIWMFLGLLAGIIAWAVLDCEED